MTVSVSVTLGMYLVNAQECCETGDYADLPAG